ncbi:MAG: MerR family transcriptional regulator [Frankia sp.]|nr:MerR family transcriptional regulator [Frankia sp.]
MRIGEVARRTGVAARMLRYYETQGLLTPRRHPNGYRDYTEADVRQVEIIRDLSASGVPTRVIKIVIDRERDGNAWTSACDELFANMVRKHVADIEMKIACLSMSRESLTRLLHDAGQRLSD